MIDQKIRVLSEALARAVDRRSFVKRAGGAVVAGIATIVLKPTLASAGASANASAGPALAGEIPAISCAPPGPYCNTGGGDLSGCRGGHCFAHGTVANACHVYYAFYATGCWSTVSGGGYWTCCDCQCNNGNTCGCAQFNPGGDPRSH
jgi:hypothetical protein